MTQAAGKLNHRVAFFSRQSEQDSAGDLVETFHHVRDAWAEVVPVSAREFIASASVQSKVVARIVVRHQALHPDWLIRFRGRYYNIEGILSDPVSGLEYLTLPVSFNVQAIP